MSEGREVWKRDERRGGNDGLDLHMIVRVEALLDMILDC